MPNERKQSLTTALQRVALVTAGSAGLGAQIARVLAPDFRVVSDNACSC
jgi:NAD(P)-dependent dehydrogenase (short-subunit alcohol dehydrogenase family)